VSRECAAVRSRGFSFALDAVGVACTAATRDAASDERIHFAQGQLFARRRAGAVIPMTARRARSRPDRAADGQSGCSVGAS
jgi:hypothetical protein